MSRFFPHTSYAEDQPLGHTILLTHILTRAVTTGSVVGLGIFAARETVARFFPGRVSPSPAPGLPTPVTAAKTVSPLLPRLVRQAGTATAWTIGFVALATVARMWGREDIEWRDRSWRLTQHLGQLEVDDWTYGSMLAAAALAATARGRAAVFGKAAAGWRGWLGLVGLGSVGGTIGYMGWRYGVHGGKFPVSA